MSSSTTQTTLDSREIHRQTNRILNANFLHLIPISLLFLPLTFSAFAAIQFYISFSSDISVDPPNVIDTIITSSQTLLSLKTLIIVIAFTFFLILPTAPGIALITYTKNRIPNANFLDFIPISLIFLPLTFSASAAIQFYKSFSSSDISATAYVDPPTLLLIETIIASSQTLLSLKTLIIVIAFTFFVILPTVAGIALITYITNQSIYHKHLTFSSTIKSLSLSYIPLLSTVIAGLIKLTPLSLLFTLSLIAISEANKALGFPFDLLSIFSIFSWNSFVFFVLVVFFIVIWGSAPAIAVLELKSGFEPLRQSANQSTEFRSHSFSIVFGSGCCFIGLMIYSVFNPIFGRITTNWISILNISFFCLYSSLMILQYVVANTVLYMQCKVACGEEYVKTAVEGEVSGDYVSVAANNQGDNVSDEQPKDEGYRDYFSILWVSYLLWIIFITVSYTAVTVNKMFKLV